MECTWDAALLRRGEELPPELLRMIQHGSDAQYLNAMAKASLDPRYTYLMFAHCEDLFAHICANLRSHASLPTAIATLGRIMPFAPFLMPYAERLLVEEYSFESSEDDSGDLLYLLGLFRLFAFEWRDLKKFIRPTKISVLLKSPHRPIVYLAIRILQLYYHGADHWFEQMVKRYLGEDTADSNINGTWDDRVIDYRFLTLWEEDRFRKVLKLTNEVEIIIRNLAGGQSRLLSLGCFDDSTALIGNTLLPRMSNESINSIPTETGLIQTATVSNNLRRIASAMKATKSLLIEGLSGAGKTVLIRHVAQSLGKLQQMITLHLNQQSDAKLLMGVYTTGESPGSFVWKPGVLATAVQQGRWVLIEDIERAPDDIIGTLLPLIEKGELMIPNRKEIIHATPGFRIIATARTSINHRGQNISPVTDMLGMRHWYRVAIEMPRSEELQQVTSQLYPRLSGLLPQLHTLYKRLLASWHKITVSRQGMAGTSRVLSPRDLLKWCERVSNHLLSKTTLTSNDIDNIFLEALDCFASPFTSGQTRSDIASLIAEELRVDPRRRDYLLTQRDVQYIIRETELNVGRYGLTRSLKSKRANPAQSSFSTNPHTNCMLEKIAGAVINREPLLLVGETGVGKTAAVQYLATHLGKKLVPFNLSQQSEAGDLLGGFKPVNARSLFVSMKDQFDDLFAESFSLTKNQQFLELLGKQTSRGNWKAVCKLWQQALNMVDQQRADPGSRAGEAPSKKRKVESKKAIDFVQWDAFAVKVTDMERRIASGDDAFAFSFVEGNIVKALRNGDWILLDEINLASPDTLEAIADLLDPRAPSLLLTESGKIDRIEAHPSFRVFAAMNPATDVGKKDLPPGIRSRFTEIYVDSPDNDITSLSSIVKSYLRHEIANDQAIPVDVSKLYQNILELASQNKLVDGAGARPHFSLRTLTRTLSYSKHIAPFCSLRRALYEGFQMSFLTLLDAESVKLVQPLLEGSLFGKQTNLRAELHKPLRRPTERHVQVHLGSKHWMQSGKLNIEEQPHYILTPFIRENLENLIRATSTRQFPVLIQGPTSSGKTSMIEYLAKRTGHKFLRINNHEFTDLQEYLGTYVSGVDGRLQFQDGVLVKALREGHWLVLDELNLAPSDVLEALNRLLDDNRELLIPETQEVIHPHQDFMLFATQNPAGLYGGRKTLSRAFRNRFLELHFDDIPIDQLQEILHRRTQLPESRCRRIVGIYRELSVLRQENRLFEQKSFATLRDLFRWAQRPNDTIEQLATNGYMLLGERVRKEEERQLLKDTIERVMSEKVVSSSGHRVTIDESRLYSQECPEVLQYERDVQNKSVVWTKAMRRLYILVARALENNEPVLLVGETGCGKTTVCQMVAEALGKKLHSVNAHQNTETGDLIGSQRPLRNRAVIEANLRHQLLSSELLQNLDNAAGQQTDAILDMYDHAVASLPRETKSVYSHSPLHALIQNERTRFKALFEWVDGSLVQAMKEGSFFLLDEISLADDSVLERINSVLESQRSILLAEKGSVDSTVEAVPGFHFLSTMNPGGDYGKRELSPALRNRFTEIWVPPLNDVDDVAQILRAKLTPSARDFVNAMVDFAQWFKNRYDTSAGSSTSIRDILSWASFVNMCSSTVDIASAIVNGAAMVYIDTLGANPAGLMASSTLSIDQEHKICIDRLSQFLARDARRWLSGVPHIEATDKIFMIGSFSLPRKSCASQSTAFSFDPVTTRINAMRLLRALQLPKPIMLEGNPGVGKTALITAIAQAVGAPLTRINLSEQTDLIDLFGCDVPVAGADTGNFAWRDAPFLRAMKNGEWVLLDEMNLASQSVLEGLNACLDHRGEVFVPELGQTFSRHPDFKLFAAQNPHHQGGGRKGLPASFVNRFTVAYADAFRPADLKLISQRTFPGIDPAIIDNIIAFVHDLDHETVHQKRVGAKGAPWEFNYRDISRLLALATSSHALVRAGSVRDFTDLLFSQRFRSTFDQLFVDDLFRRHFKNDFYMSDLFPTSSSAHVQLGLSVLQRSSITAHPKHLMPRILEHGYNLRILQSIMLCIQQNWPVVLTGRSGAGKTEHIERLAATIGREVVTLAINAETDAMDLIGGFEQTDSLWEAKQSQRTLNDKKIQAILTGLTTSTSLSDQSSQSKVVLEHHTKDTVTGPRFEWIDGVLIDALREGKWLVLDNANLCSPSVLDRLNSLLEPNGVLILNERNNADGSPQIVTPHQDFRIFLAINPRYGELSRAMRNRAVELHLPETNPATTKGLDPLFPEHSMLRLRSAQMLSGLTDKDISLDLDPDIFVDHLSAADRPLLQRFVAQLSKGLYGLPETSLFGLNKAMQSPAQIQADAAQCSTQLYKAASSQTQVPADFARVQTFHPLNNQAVVQFSQHAAALAPCIAFVYDCSIQLGSMSELLRRVRANTSLGAKLMRLERSIGLHASSSDGQLNTGSISSLVTTLMQQLSRCDELLLAKPSTDIVKIKPVTGQIIALGMILLESFLGDKLDPASLNAILALGRRATSSITAVSPDSSFSPICTIQQAFDSILLATGYDSNFACAALWKHLKPRTPANQEQFESLLRLDNVLERFDYVCRRLVLPLETVVDLRLSFTRTVELAACEGYDASELATNVEDLVSEVAGPNPTSELGRVPHFQHVFQLLSEHFSSLNLGGHIISTRQRAIMDIFAQLETKASQGYIGTENPLLRLSSIVTSGTARGSEYFTHATIPASLIYHLHTTNQVQLSQLSLLENEIGSLGRIVSSQAHLLGQETCNSLDLCLGALVADVLSALESQEHNAELRQVATALRRQLNSANSISSFMRPSNNTTINASPDKATADGLVTKGLELVILYLRANFSDEPTKLKQAANAWACLSCACLHLYVPRNAFDPALEAKFKRSVDTWQFNALTDRLQAFQALRAQLTGEIESLRANLLRQDLTALGSVPQLDNIYRPEISQLSDLQLDLDGLIRILQPLWSAIRQPTSILPMDANLIMNLTKLKQRLTSQYRAYHDFTAPIVGLIDCLFIAQRLDAQANADEQRAADSWGLPTLVPFIDASFYFWRSDQAFIDINSSLDSRQDVTCWLSTIAVRSAVSNTVAYDPLLLEAIDERFNQLYRQWKSELSEERRATAEKSSLYKYRYRGDKSDEATQEDLDELFPSSSLDSNDIEQKRAKSHARDDALVVAQLHQNIFEPRMAKDSDVQELLIQFGSGLANQRRDVDSKQLIPTLILLLHDAHAKLHTPRDTRQAYNIYTDSNIAQMEKLSALIQDLTHRFSHLQSSWPEHATPAEVLRQCDAILEVPHLSTLPSLLPLLEKLYAAVNDWQSIASRQFNVHDLLINISDMIISWRQLELSTWAGLFDKEWERCQDTAASWWYVAYETIVAATAGIEKTPKDLMQYKKDLLSILGDFLQSSGLGEYTARLQMLRGFEAYLAADQARSNSRDSVRQALAHFNRFYGHFESAIARKLLEARGKLEKEVQNVIQLASWKDRNIDVLRQSALSSHRKLLRLVKKFRDLLGQPVLTILNEGLRGGSLEAKAFLQPGGSLQEKGGVAYLLVNSRLSVWHQRSNRFRNVDQTCRVLDAKFYRLQDGLSGPTRLKTFAEELGLQISELEKSTPSISTVENKALVQHLKTRKRRLLADVLKSVRKMGYQTAVSEQILRRQDSTSTILAYLPALINGKFLLASDIAEYELHRFICIMPSVRENSRKHSDELTSAEVTRCVALLESMLQVGITSHQALAAYLEEFVEVNQALNEFKALAVSNGCGLSRFGTDASGVSHTRTAATYLHRMICTAVTLLQAQENLSSENYSVLIDFLNSTSKRLELLLERSNRLPKLPAGLQSDGFFDLEAQHNALNQELQVGIEHSVSLHPETGPIISQLLKWIPEQPSADQNALFNGHITVDLDSWTQELIETLDTILVSAQDVEAMLDQYHTSTNDSWVVKQLALVKDTFAALRMRDFGKRMTRLMSRLQYCQFPDSTTLTDVVTMLNILSPIIGSYQRSITSVLRLHCSLCAHANNTGYSLATSFISIAQRGFCKPSEKTQEDSGAAGDVEAGTGLGDDEGAEDISKDIGDEEDLTELANDAQMAKDGPDMDHEKDAVDMADEELVGEVENVDETSEMDEEASNGSEEEISNPNEETGDVSRDPNAVDEKVWDGEADNKKAEKEADSSKGIANNEDMAAAQNPEGEEFDDQLDHEAEAVAGSEEDTGQQEERIDPHVQDRSNLDLPDDMDQQNDHTTDDEDSESASFSDDFQDTADVNLDSPDDAHLAENEKHPNLSDEDQDGEDQMMQGVEEPNVSAEDEELTGSPRLQKQEENGPYEEGNGVTYGDETMDFMPGGEAAATPSIERDTDLDLNDAADEDQQEQKGASGTGSKRNAGDLENPDNANEKDKSNLLQFKQIGDALDEWYKRHREISSARHQDEQQEVQFERGNMEGVEFEHLPNDETIADAQAIGAASAEQSVALNEENAILNDDRASVTSKSDKDEDRQRESHDRSLEENERQIESTDDRFEAPQLASFVGEERNLDDDREVSGSPIEEPEDHDIDNVEEQMINAHISNVDELNKLRFEDAQNLWAKHEDSTRNLALVLTEHLRLILQPTQATKMRGDFRTGKRLNIKRIIPYIASSYKRDKIWMRRSTPTKRSYQVMLAIDDSKSMAESQSYDLAFQTLALIAKSMSMLEVGDLAVVGFGEDVEVAHDFSTPFTSEAGAKTFRHFTFSQTKTNVKHLLTESLALFRNARLRASGPAADLWQLQLIISDGICDDHPSIRQLVREAHEERIMIVFIVVDFATQTGYDTSSSKQSILDMRKAQFFPDDAGNTELRMMKYLDTFPFRYYLIVQNIQELPNVLAGALRQWFAEVVESAG